MRQLKILLVLASTLAAPVLSAQQGDTTILHAGTLLYDATQAPLVRQSVVVRAGTIKEIRPGFITDIGDPDDVRIIDLSNSFVMPGLIDVHTHITTRFDQNLVPRLQAQSDAAAVLAAAAHAENVLRSGFTTIRNVGDPTGIIFALRDSINRGETIGPRILAAGALITRSGGHVDDFYGTRGNCDGPHSCRRVVREQVFAGADVIKVAVSGGAASEWGGPDNEPALYEDEIVEIVNTAHRLGRKVAAHAHGTQAINLALKAGVDSIEHGTYLDQDSVSLFRSSGAYLVPTALVGITGRDMLEFFRHSIPAQHYERAYNIGASMAEAIDLAHEGGVKIALGTDSGISDAVVAVQELEIYVANGLTEAESLQTATLNAAALLGLSARVGSLEAGKAADIIAVEGNPLDDISILRKVNFVMHNGAVHRSSPP